MSDTFLRKTRGRGLAEEAEIKKGRGIYRTRTNFGAQKKERTPEINEDAMEISQEEWKLQRRQKTVSAFPPLLKVTECREKDPVCTFIFRKKQSKKKAPLMNSVEKVLMQLL